MSSVPARQNDSSVSVSNVNGVNAQAAADDCSEPETIEARFRRLESIWTTATGHLSSSTKIVAHPAFREIVGLGEAVIPLMLQDLEKRPRLWVWALPEITGANPVAASDRGNIGKMSEAWLRWATCPPKQSNTKTKKRA